MSPPEPYYSDESVTLHLGDCRNVLVTMESGSVDAVVCDPPYALEFMGREWDSFKPAQFQEWCETWARECLRVLKPGGHLLAFGGTRTWHRLACAIEDAGLEIRDSVADLTGIDGAGLLWIHGQGFPKSLDVSKAIDKRRDWSLVERLAVEVRRARAAAGLSLRDVGDQVQQATGGQHGRWYHRGGHMFFETGLSLPGRAEWEHLRRVLPIEPEFDALFEEAEREVIRERRVADRRGDQTVIGLGHRGNADVTAAATEAAARWEGWGTALKPAWEPIVVARKPLTGTVAQNVLQHGTGALNIAGCLVPHADNADRWPPNAALGAEAAAEMNRQSADSARIFPIFKYEPKAPKSERPKLPDGTAWPTVKPLDLMRWLVRLVTPPGGLVLDLFAGSGTTGEACVVEGFRCILVDKDPVAAELIKARLSKPIQPCLFSDLTSDEPMNGAA